MGSKKVNNKRNILIKNIKYSLEKITTEEYFGYNRLLIVIKQADISLSGKKKLKDFKKFLNKNGIEKLKDWDFKNSDKKKNYKKKNYKIVGYQIIYDDGSFYTSEKWRNLRKQIIKEQGATCAKCGLKGSYGISIHVDHIKPRSKFPELELDKNNLQVLCSYCNLEKR